MTNDDDFQSALEQPVNLPDNTILYPAGKKPGRSRAKTVILVFFVLTLLSSAGFAAWNYLLKPKPKAAVNPPAQTAANSMDSAAATNLKKYKSEELTLRLSHPANWQVAEANGGLTLTSPELIYQTVDKGEGRGVFRIYIRMGARDVDGKYIGAGMAIQPSEKLVYTEPGSTQRKDTNLTLFGAKESGHFTFFMVTGDFSLKKDDQMGPNYGREAETYIIAGGYGAKDQKDDLAFANVPLDKYQTRTYTQAIDIVKSLQL